MIKILFMPLLQLPTGHHRVADALIHSLQRGMPYVLTKKIDFINYMSPALEKMIAYLYLKWIDHAPHTYDKLYRNFMYPASSQRFQFFEDLFLGKMLELLQEEKPDLIVCTQAFPSFLISRLKSYHKIDTPVINIYTDFFINNLWGIEGIDYHFVPDASFKHELLSQTGLQPSQVLATGIPIDESFSPLSSRRSSSPTQVIIAGGSGGLGGMEKLLKQIPPISKLNFLILCGTNVKLLNEIKSWNHQALLPIPYIASREQMNKLYDSAAALITKPGGVTISESLFKKIPVFIHSELPGQETLNREYLLKQHLAFRIDQGQALDEQLLATLTDSLKMERWEKAVNTYLSRLETTGAGKLAEIINTFSNPVAKVMPGEALAFSGEDPYSREYLKD